MAKFKYSVIVLVLLLTNCVQVRASNSALVEVDTLDNVALKQKFVSYLTSNAPKDTEVSDILMTYENGTWPDINYKSKRRGSWETLQHLNRLGILAQAYANNESSYFEKENLLAEILDGVEHWLSEDYTNSNWWNGKIGVPEAMLKIFFLLDDALPENTLAKAQDTVLKRTEMGMTGQNKVWLAGIAFMKALLNNDTKIMQVASDSIWSELKVATSEGIQPDWSFHQHGPQQQFGNYGQHFAERMIMWGSILQGSSYAMPDEKLNILRNYILNGQSWVLWKGKIDISGCGRKLFKGVPQQRANAMTAQIRKMIELDPAFKNEYRLLLENKKLIGHKSFWRSEMAVHKTSDWHASVKMSSTRLIGSETCNSENMCGIHLGDGVQLTYLTGLEYKDITPLWDWHRLPGTTCDQGMDELVPKGWNQSYGGSDFSGVLGDNESGMAAMIYKRTGLTAHKAWFFCCNQIVCMGAAIEGETIGKVFTSIEQSRLNGEVVSTTAKLSKGTHHLDSGLYVNHAGITYKFLNNATCSIKEVNGNWKNTFPTFHENNDTGEIFSIWLDHGKSPNNGHYVYFVFPGTSLQQANELSDKVKIISNTSKVQAIESSNELQAVFYESGKLQSKNHGEIQVDKPCLLLLKNNRILVSDPTHQSSEIEITLKNKTLNLNFPTGFNIGNKAQWEGE